MLKKSSKKGDAVWHRKFGRAVLVNFYDEAQTLCRITFTDRAGVFIFSRAELHNSPPIITNLKPGWYVRGSSPAHIPSHFWFLTNSKKYRSACGKLMAAGSELIPEINAVDVRCKRCEKSRCDGIKTTLFDFEKL